MNEPFPAAPPARTAPRERITLLLGAVVVLCNLAAIALGVLNLKQSLHSVETQAESLTLNLAHVLDQSLSSSARSIDVALQALADEFSREAQSGSKYLDENEVLTMLARFKGWLPETESIRVFDAKGQPRWASRGNLGQVQDICQCFNTLRDDPARGLVVGRPVNRPGSSGWLIPFSRRINRQDGSFGGIVTVIVPLEHFTELLSRPRLGEGGTAILRYEDFSLITRSPPHPGQAGTTGHVWASDALRRNLEAGRTSFTYRSADTSDGVERLNAVRRVEGLPLLLVVGLSQDSYLAQWRRDAVQAVTILAIFLLVSSGSALVIGRLYGRQRDAAARAIESRARLEATLHELRKRDLALDAAEQIGRLGAYSIDIASGQVIHSRAFDMVLGLPAGQPLSHDDWLCRIHPDDLPAARTRFEEGLLRDGQPYDMVYRLHMPDGTLRWIHGLGRAERDADGRLVAVYGAVQDISARKQVEHSLQQAVDDYQSLIARIPVGIVKFRLDAHGQPGFTYVSPRFCEQVGLTADCLLGSAEAFLGNIIDADRNALRDTLHAHMKLGHAFGWEGRIRVGADLRWISMLASPTIQGDGATLWDGVSTEITDRKLAELALREIEERNRLLLEYSPVGILQFDRELRVSYCNQQFARIMEAPLSYMNTLDCTTLQDQRVIPDMRAALAGGLSRYEGAYRTTYSGQELAISMTCAPLRDTGGEIVGGIAILQDITERVRKDEELARYQNSLEELVSARTADLEASRAEAERLARVKSEFLANMSHEIRTPLNGVLGLARMGFRDSAGRNATQAVFARILSSGQLLLGIINDVLDYSKIEAGKLGIEAIPVEPARVVGDTLVLMEDAATNKGLRLQLKQRSPLPAVCLSDPLRLAQILVNLLSNAIKFTEHGSITLEVGRDGDALVFSVIDTGIGMTAEQLTTVFAPFEQADNSTTRRFGGTGLGLAITRRIVELMGGSLHAESQAGAGSRFEVRLPCIEVPAPAPAPSTPLATGEGTRLVGLRILVAEDNEVNQLVLEDNLASEGAEVTLAVNGQEAVERVRQQGPEGFDVVLMDLQMPVMDGYEATRQIHALAPALPIIGQTAHALDEERAACLAAGMVDHLAKPIDPDRLIASILHHTRPCGTA
ncbi:MAG: ATP-binding protein [Zoogloea sp.]|uniref:ATP-binding protein n=1 Tax=Zoogloea sp. TaxID=49181 RepID=UPI00262E14E5|nr:ATP-binding protein [Zoogloea sp.]MDD3328674.1 ATP-binding protein [Zoogloea sp.]